ncbi:class I SAM-dependent methyltransferase [Candidatus Pacearchaeota archaeon]|nr:class I SAM-dependent methyltransferase [Candidatus Pacearchaeota archaeon]
MRSFDVIGNIAILKPENGNKERAGMLLKQNKNIRTIVEKTERVKGRLRTLKTKYLAGERTKEALHRENGCAFRLNIETCYFSSRLSGERARVAEKIRKITGIKKKNVLVMFAGVAPFPIVIAKIAKPKKIVSIELGRECCRYAAMNMKLNKLNNIEIMQGDVKRIAQKLKKKNERFDVIVMPRPRLKGTFLKEAFSVSKKGTLVFYYDFCKEEELAKILEKIKEEDKNS